MIKYYEYAYAEVIEIRQPHNQRSLSMKIIVLAGGLSTERSVSLVSGVKICESLRRSGHQAVLLDMFFGLEGTGYEPETLFEALPPIPVLQIDRQAPDLAALQKSRKDNSGGFLGTGVLELCRQADLVFLGLHGACGEDGRIQGLFDLMGIAYTGSGHLGSTMAMDKIFTRHLVAAAGVAIPNGWAVGSMDELKATSATFPCVAKIPNGGSSIGVAICNSPAELEAAAAEFFGESDQLLVEEYISGREFSCGVLDDAALPAIEIVPKTGFFDYENKYQDDATEEICPANVDAVSEQTMRTMALAAHRALGLGVYSRSDFRMRDDGKIYFLEVNTLPGMTQASLLPKEAAAAGVNYDALCQSIAEQSLRIRKKEAGPWSQ